MLKKNYYIIRLKSLAILYSWSTSVSFGWNMFIWKGNWIPNTIKCNIETQTMWILWSIMTMTQLIRYLSSLDTGTFLYACTCTNQLMFKRSIQCKIYAAEFFWWVLNQAKHSVFTKYTLQNWTDQLLVKRSNQCILLISYQSSEAFCVKYTLQNCSDQ